MTDEQRNQFQEQMLARLRALLAERVQLKVHTETKEMPVYALIVAKNGAKIAKTADTFTKEASLSVRRGADGKTELSGKQAPLASLARQLSNQTGRPVIDKTELEGHFDFKITFAGDLADSDGPSIFTALEEELGLKLDPQRGPVELIVIDSAQRPSAN